MRQAAPCTFGLVGPAAEPEDAFEIRFEDERAPRPRPPADERVQLQLVRRPARGRGAGRCRARRRRGHGPACRSRRRAAGSPCRRTRRSRSARDRRRGRARGKPTGRAIFSVMPSTRIAAREKKSSERSASNSHMTRNASSTSIDAQPLDRRHAKLVAGDEIDLLERSDAEQPGSVSGEEDLIAGLGEPSDQPAEIAVRLRGEEQLRLLDRKDDARGLGRARLEPAHESDARRGSPRQRLADQRVHDLCGPYDPPSPTRARRRAAPSGSGRSADPTCGRRAKSSVRRRGSPRSRSRVGRRSRQPLTGRSSGRAERAGQRAGSTCRRPARR